MEVRRSPAGAPGREQLTQPPGMRGARMWNVPRFPLSMDPLLVSHRLLSEPDLGDDLGCMRTVLESGPHRQDPCNPVMVVCVFQGGPPSLSSMCPPLLHKILHPSITGLTVVSREHQVA